MSKLKTDKIGDRKFWNSRLAFFSFKNKAVFKCHVKGKRCDRLAFSLPFILTRITSCFGSIRALYSDNQI